MTDLLVFLAVVAVAMIGSILVGMIVAGRIDRRLSPAPAAGQTPVAADAQPEEDQER